LTSTDSEECLFSVTAAGQSGGEVSLNISGRIAIDTINRLLPKVQSILPDLKPGELRVDLSQVEYIDSAGALALISLEQEASRRGIPFAFTNVTDEAKRVIALVDRQALAATQTVIRKRSEGLIEWIGELSLNVLDDFVHLMTFLGELLSALCYSLLHPRSVRWGDVLFYMKRAGLDALPILGLLSMLLGLIIAFMSSLQLKQFGANIFVPSLLGIAMVKELGPIMTAILVAGRSGSAFAAEIGTMIVNEEVDALVTMGFEPIRFLTVPKVIAALLVVPLLTLYSDLFGIIGGLVIGVLGLDLTVRTYIQETKRILNVFEVVTSLIKSLVFALLIAGIGCQRGFLVRGGAESVGRLTTSAVVAGIFLIIVADAIFAIMFYYIR
jgi:phospholipid/cholesterol/gamma-HCH transport system permease protein